MALGASFEREKAVTAAAADRSMMIATPITNTRSGAEGEHGAGWRGRAVLYPFGGHSGFRFFPEALSRIPAYPESRGTAPGNERSRPREVDSSTPSGDDLRLTVG